MTTNQTTSRQDMLDALAAYADASSALTLAKIDRPDDHRAEASAVLDAWTHLHTLAQALPEATP